MKRIDSLEELKKESVYNEKKGIVEFFIVLNAGCKSSKGIVFYPVTNPFDILHEIDGSYEEDLTEEQLRNETHIVLAIERGAFFKYDS